MRIIFIGTQTQGDFQIYIKVPLSDNLKFYQIEIIHST